MFLSFCVRVHINMLHVQTCLPCVIWTFTHKLWLLTVFQRVVRSLFVSRLFGLRTSAFRYTSMFFCFFSRNLLLCCDILFYTKPNGSIWFYTTYGFIQQKKLYWRQNESTFISKNCVLLWKHSLSLFQSIFACLVITSKQVGIDMIGSRAVSR